MEMKLTERVAEQLRRQLNSEDATVTIANDHIIEIASASSDSGRSLEIRVRGAADLEVAFIVPSKPGGPFEQVFAGPVEEADKVIREACAFTCDLVAERVVLAWDPSLLRGGRRFLKASELTAAAKYDYAWAVSWRGGQDWAASAA